MKLSDMMDTSKDHFNWYIETILKGEKIIEAGRPVRRQ